MNTLGISCFYHDSSAALLKDGHILSAGQEERFNRKKNTSDFPIESINFCIQDSGLNFHELDSVAFYEKPFLKFSRVLFDHLIEFPFSYKSFMRSMPQWLDQRLSLPMQLENEIGFKGKVFFVKHHHSHAASAFYPSPFSEAAILTIDGVGEWATMSRGRGVGNDLVLNEEIHYPHSLGLLYTAFTVFIGFEANAGEGKTMGLAGLGEPRYLRDLQKIVYVNEDGSFFMDASYFSFRRGGIMWTRKFEKIFGLPRKPGDTLTQRHKDLAASVQKFLEDLIILNARILQKKTKLKNICLAGGVALNCITNHKILEATDFKEIFIQPAAGDAGGALGAALFVQHSLFGIDRQPQSHSYLGPSFSSREIEKALSVSNLPYERLTEHDLLSEISRELAEDKIVGWFQGRMEFGPRALGHRSILASPCNPQMKTYLNEIIKKRESFRPFAPMILEERVQEYFDLKGSSPYMLLAASVKAERSSLIPAVVHDDSTARIQTVNDKDQPLLAKLLRAFEARTSIPVLLNTSFNGRGEPVVCSPSQAINSFKSLGLDLLVMGEFIIRKNGKLGEKNE